MVKKNINLITYITFPLLSLLIVIAHPVFLLLLGEKWLPSVPMFQIICIFGMFTPLNRANSQIFRAIGDGKTFFKLQFIKQIIGLILILSFVRYGIFPFLWASAGVGITSYMINLYFTHTRFGYSYKDQLQDIIPNLLVAGSVCGISLYIMHSIYFLNSYQRLIIGSVSYIFLYLFATYVFKLKGFQLCKEFMSSK